MDCTQLHSPKKFLDASLVKLTDINNTHIKLAEHWCKLKGILEQHKYVEQLGKRVDEDRKRLENEAATKIQLWWKNLCNHKRSFAFTANIDYCIQGPHINCSSTSNEFKENARISEHEICSEMANTNDGYITDDKAQHAYIAARKIQAWWRGVFYRRKIMLDEHKVKLQLSAQEFKNAPCSEANPREERSEPLNQRIERYMYGLTSIVLTERKAMVLRLNRLADRSHVTIECMLNKGIFTFVLDCLSELNRSEAHLYVIRPLCELIVKLLSYTPFVEPFVQKELNRLVFASVHLINNNYKDKNIVTDMVCVLKILSSYQGFAQKMDELRFDWFMRRFKQYFACLKSNDARSEAFKELCRLQNFLHANN